MGPAELIEMVQYNHIFNDIMHWSAGIVAMQTKWLDGEFFFSLWNNIVTHKIKWC
jgi:hypothetical protein